jgi:hypothetical protein
MLFLNFLKDFSEFIPIKIIQEPVSSFTNQLSLSKNAFHELNELKTDVKPSNLSGPLTLNQLNGRCFDYFNKK